VVPVLAASWMLGARPLAAVVGLSLALALVMMVEGLLTPASLAARVLALLVVAAVGRTAAISTAEVRRARQHELRTLVRAAHLLLGRAVDRRDVAAEVVEVAAGALAPDGRSAVLVRVDSDGATVVARTGAA